MDIFSYGFMRSAFIVAIFISIITPLIGNVIVLKRLSTVGDALSHSSLAGVAIGLVFGFNPVSSAVLFSVAAALIIELVRKSFPKYSEIATSIVMSFGIGLAAVASGFIKSSANFNSFLFGSIVAISTAELIGVIFLALAVFVLFIILYKELLYIIFDEEGASLAGVPVERVNLIFTILTAVTVSIASRTVGALIVSSLMVLPVACAMLISKSYFKNIVLSVVFALIFTILGLFISFWFDLKPSGTIVLISIATLFVIMIYKKLFK